MENFPLLPPLKNDGDGLAIIPDTGIWFPVPAVALNNIAENLDVTKIAAKFIDIDSIPSMWARPLLFEIALYDENHPMHECILGEWRGLLALLALKEQRNFPLTTKPIMIPNADAKNIPEFLRALRKLLPEHTLDENTAWDEIHLILFKNKPIGMTSPTTLLCTSIDYIDYISVLDVPWFNPPFLCDPNGHLNADEKASVAGWLDNFYTQKIIPLRNNDVKGNLAARILDFTTDLGGIPDGKVKLSNTPLGMAVGLYNGMNFPIARKEYFTEKLFVISQNNAFLKSNVLMPKGSANLKVNGRSVTPILPIKKELLDKFDVNELNQRITFEETPTGIKVNLQYPSPGDDGNMIISQEYFQQKDDDAALFNYPQIVEIDHLPVLEIWPDFRMSNWKTYYTYFRKAQNTFDARPLSAEPNTSSLEENTEITKTSDFPKAMVCKYKDVNTLNSEEAGILLISAQNRQPDAATWNIGIDFGTSGTTVYRQDTSDTTPDPISFDDRLLQITNSTPANRTEVYQQFFSSRSEKTPFFSLFQQHSNSRNKSQSGENLEPLLDGRIYFVENYEIEENVVSNLKWSSDPEDRIRTRAFIEQICLQCAAEAIHNGVKMINWYFSYPLAFSEADKAQFRTTCSNATNACEKITGIQNGNVTFESESIVTANFFADKFGGFADGAVCIDIGGETSDISIWQGNTLCWETSIRFAGRTIFLDLLKHNYEFLRIFRVADDVIPTLQKVSKSDKFYGQADTWINAWINNSKDGLENLFATYGGQIKDTPFIPLIALGISGLLYYVGLILNYLAKNKGFEPTMPNVYIGGNGSRILHWLANGHFTPDSENGKYLKDIILAASGFDLNAIFDLQITPQPKHEAAAGLVVPKTPLITTTDKFPVLAGEGFIENDENYSWTTRLTPGRFENHLKSSNKLVQIENFIEIFNAGFGKALNLPINLDPTLKKNLTSDLNDGLKNLALKSVGERVVEPIFITVLKELLDRKTEQWALESKEQP